MRSIITCFNPFVAAFLLTGSFAAKAQNTSPYWSAGGNNNAASTAKLGTTNAVPLNLTTNNLSRIYIAPNGNIGIGTTSPTSMLNVQGPTLLSIFTSTDALGPTSGSGVIGYTKFMPTAAGQRLGYFLTGSQNNGVDPGNGTGMVGYSDGAWTSASRPSYLSFETAKSGSRTRSEAMRITSKGFVGVGTVNPTYRLQSSDSTVAIYGEGLGNYSIGVSGQGGGYGVYGYGSYGVFGYGTSNGVFGSGHFGISGSTSDATGDAVHGYATGQAGYGGNFTSNNSYGVYASGGGNSYAGYFNGSTYSTGAYQGSDKRLKKNIAEFTGAMSIIKKLKPRTYEFLTEGKMAEMQLPTGKHYGLIAQELEVILPDLVKETPQNASHLSDSTGNIATTSSAPALQSFKAVNYTELIPILIKGMQEQDSTVQALSTENTSLKDRMQTLERTVARLTVMLSSNPSAAQGASLEVPVPNPAKSNTTIRYSIPGGVVSARLTVLTMLGQVIKEEKLTSGNGQVTLNVSDLASGTYPCILWVNGQQVVSKQLLVSK